MKDIAARGGVSLLMGTGLEKLHKRMYRKKSSDDDQKIYQMS